MSANVERLRPIPSCVHSPSKLPGNISTSPACSRASTGIQPGLSHQNKIDRMMLGGERRRLLLSNAAAIDAYRLRPVLVTLTHDRPAAANQALRNAPSAAFRDYDSCFWNEAEFDREQTKGPGGA